MIALDTNVLVRVLVDDPGHVAQTKLARDRVKKAGTVFIAQIVQVELVWVLDACYGLSRPEIAAVLEHLARNDAYVLQREQAFLEALDAYRKGGADFADYLIEAESRAADLALLTFDKKLARVSGVTVLKE